MVAALASTIVGCAKRSTKSEGASTTSSGALDAGDQWSLIQGKFEDRPLVMRVRTSITELPDPTKPTRLVVRWEYRDAGKDGLPGSDALDAMSHFEDRLTPAIERGGNAVLVAVATTSGARELIFYVADPRECERRFNVTFADDDPPLPVKLSSFADPSWSELKGILDQIAH
jgi:hypothetical protein